MKFTPEEISIAQRLSANGLHWEPQAGHYVYDLDRACDRSSPFQDGVFFILNYERFMGMIGGVDRFKQVMVWLPTWEDCRKTLAALGVPDEDVFAAIESRDILADQAERVVLYRLIESLLVPDAAKPQPHAVKQ